MGRKLLILTTIAMALTISCGRDSGFWSAEDGKFVRDGKTEYFIGANMWYAPLLASDTDVADLERLGEELDCLKSMGVNNLRVLAGADGDAGVKWKVEPALQTAPGVYDENVFVGLDRFLVELGKRDMTAVIYLNNAWEWSGGFGQYLEWTGHGKAVSANDVTWEEYCEITSKVTTDERAKSMFMEHVKKVVSRVNTVTGRPYSEDPAIFSWQICNEPRCFVRVDSVKAEFEKWLVRTAALIKSIDNNHMVSVGSEGLYGCEVDMDLFEKIHSCPDIDYLTMHIWPANWNWVRKDSLETDLPEAYAKTDKYIDMHIASAEKLRKPVVIEEFGYPRDGYKFDKSTPVAARDAYYTHIFRRLEDSAKSDGVLAGVNFWAWGGEAGQSAESIWWHRGDDYCGDPAQEPQGLYSVYESDTATVAIIRNFNELLRKPNKND